MKPTETLARETTPEGSEFALWRRDGVYHLSIDREELMSSRAHGSEEALARLALAALPERKAPRVLIGGLGFGYTLRAALDRLPSTAQVVIGEFFATLLEWHRSGPLGALAGRPLDDRRVTAVRADIWTLLDGRGSYDAILLDVDNGPEAFTLLSNHRLYGKEGLARIGASLSEGGVLGVWSGMPSPEFQKLLSRSGFEAWTEAVPARPGVAKRDHRIFLARRRGGHRRSGLNRARSGSSREA